jgi:hypothetical protein
MLQLAQSFSIFAFDGIALLPVLSLRNSLLIDLTSPGFLPISFLANRLDCLLMFPARDPSTFGGWL